MDKNTVYLRQVIVVRKDLGMPSGKLAAMVAHAAMTFLLKALQWRERCICGYSRNEYCLPGLTPNQARWLTELDPGLEDIGQVSMAKIVLAVENEAELLAIEASARCRNLAVHRVVDSGYSHNPAGTITCIAIGPDWPENIDVVTGHLPLYGSKPKKADKQSVAANTKPS